MQHHLVAGTGSYPLPIGPGLSVAPLSPAPGTRGGAKRRAERSAARERSEAVGVPPLGGRGVQRHGARPKFDSR